AVLSTNVHSGHAAGQAGHIDRRGAVDVRAVAQLREIIAAPTLDAPAARDGARALTCRGESDHPGREPADADRRQPAGGCAIAELPDGVVAPAFDSTAACHGTR